MSGRKKARDQRGLQKERQSLFAFLNVNEESRYKLLFFIALFYNAHRLCTTLGTRL